MKQNTLRFIKSVLYDLKKQYSISITIYNVTASSRNLETGVMSVTRTPHTVRAVRLPESYLTSKIYNLSYIASNKNFTYGAFYNRDTAIFLVDQKYDIKLEDYLIAEHKRYEIKHIEDLDFNSGYIIIANKIDGQPPQEIHEISINQRLRFGQSAERIP